eukprot:scaffold284632_cov40-Tisochrysis_lutea.AAC.1
MAEACRTASAASLACSHPPGEPLVTMPSPSFLLLLLLLQATNHRPCIPCAAYISSLILDSYSQPLTEAWHGLPLPLTKKKTS